MGEGGSGNGALIRMSGPCPREETGGTGGEGRVGGCDEVRETDTLGFVWTQRFDSKP